MVILFRPAYYKKKFTRYYLERKITLEDTINFFLGCNLSKTYFAILPIEILKKIFEYEQTKSVLEIPIDDYSELLYQSFKQPRKKLKKWLMKHHYNILYTPISFNSGILLSNRERDRQIRVINRRELRIQLRKTCILLEEKKQKKDLKEVQKLFFY